MKLATFDAGQGPRAGIVTGERVHDVSALASGAPASVKALIAAWDAWKGPLTAALPGSAGVALSSVKLMAPVPDPQKVLAIGLNYADHIARAGRRRRRNRSGFRKCRQAWRAA